MKHHASYHPLSVFVPMNPTLFEAFEVFAISMIFFSLLCSSIERLLLGSFHLSNIHQHKNQLAIPKVSLLIRWN